MEFKFERVKKDYSDFSSDKVLVNAPQTPAFPVRIASEIMSRCLSYLKSKSNISIYDPCCGAAHLLTVLGFLYSTNLNKVYGTDIDDKAIQYAHQNLNFLTSDGLMQKTRELKTRYNNLSNTFNEKSIQSSERLAAMIRGSEKTQNNICCKRWDITSSTPPSFQRVNVVITDLPYGNMTYWEGNKSDNPINKMLSNIYEILDLENSIIAIISDKQQKIKHEKFFQIKRLKHGKRQFTFLKPMNDEVES